MRAWFDALSRRDQVALFVLGAALGFWVYFQLIFVELDGRRSQLAESNDSLADKLNRVDVRVEQLRMLRDGGGVRRVNLSRTLNQISESLELPVKRLQPNSRGEIQIRFERISFDRLLMFLEQVEVAAELTVLDASISSSGADGGVNANLRIADAN